MIKQQHQQKAITLLPASKRYKINSNSTDHSSTKQYSSTAMTAYHSPAQLFAQLQQQNTSPSRTSDVKDRSSGNQHQHQAMLMFRETGYASSTPDRIKCVLLCSSTKVHFFYKFNVFILTDWIKCVLLSLLTKAHRAVYRGRQSRLEATLDFAERQIFQLSSGQPPWWGYLR